MKRPVFSIVLIMSLILGFTGVVCAQPQKAPSPATKPSPSPSPSAIPADAKTITLVFADEYPKGHTFGSIVSGAFIERVTKLGGGKIKIDYQDGGKLVKFRDSLPACQRGVADIFNIIDSYAAEQIPVFGMWVMPFVAADIEQATRICWELAHEQEDLKAGLAKWKVRPLYIWPADEKGIHIRKSVTKVEDMKGLQIRTPGGLYDMLLDSWGARPVALPSAETYIALQRGVVDGAILHLSSFWGWKWYEQTKYTVMFQSFPLSYEPSMAGINTDTWAKLPKWAQDILTKASDEHARYLIPTLKQMSLDIQKQIKDYGNEVIKIDAKETQRFKAPASSAIDKWVTQNGEAGKRTWEFVSARLKRK